MLKTLAAAQCSASMPEHVGQTCQRPCWTAFMHVHVVSPAEKWFFIWQASDHLLATMPGISNSASLAAT
jgi:hypothetical protein